jgi:hypothetical protein
MTTRALITQALVLSFLREVGNSCRNSWQDPTFLSQLLAKTYGRMRRRGAGSYQKLNLNAS